MCGNHCYVGNTEDIAYETTRKVFFPFFALFFRVATLRSFKTNLQENSPLREKKDESGPISRRGTERDA